jgi:tetratricopeptide (TPR) repeat protein
MMCCASCGISELDDAKLKECPACESVLYCSDECKEEHFLPKHEAMCKEWTAELPDDKLRDEILFTQPECSHLGDCPICFLPLPLDTKQHSMMVCCSKMICNGCVHAYYDLREEEGRIKHTCPFCRHPVPNNDEEVHRNRMKRIAANDPVAMCDMGEKLYHEGEYESAFDYYTKAVELGDIDAHFRLSVLYRKGQGVQKDEKKEIHHLEEAAIAGHDVARYNLACYEGTNRRYDRAVRHLLIAANLGLDGSIQNLKQCYVDGHVSKEEFAAALRAHQAAVDATKSPQREAAAKAEATGEISWGGTK